MAAKKKSLVVKSNRLIEASYRLTLIEQQIILFAICKCRDEQRGLSPDTPVTIKASEFSEQFGADEKSVYGQLKEAMLTLFQRDVTIYDNDPLSGKPRVTASRWISTASYVDGEGQIQIIFAPAMIPFITRLESEFTAYRLEKIGAMSSVHAIRIYEMLAQYIGIGKREIEVSWLKEMLQLSGEYPRIGNFKARVVDVAQDQINQHSDIRVSYTQRKTGRDVTHLEFTIKPEKKPEAKVVIDRAYVDKHARPGETYDQAFKRLQMNK